MAVVSRVYGHLTTLVEQGTINLDTADIRVALFNNVHAFDIAHTQWSDIKANEISGTGYSEGGIAITHTGAKLHYDAATGIYSFGKNADDTEWPASTLEAYHAVVYVYTDNAGVPADASLLLESIDFGGAEVTLNAIFPITWPPTGIFRFRPNP